MTRSLLKTLLALAALVAAFGFAACGGDDDERASDTGGTPAQSEDGGDAATSPSSSSPAPRADNLQNPDEGGKKGGKLTVLSGGDVDYMDPGQDVLHVHHRHHERDPPRAVRVPARQHAEPVPDLADGRCPRSPRTARPSR